MRKLLILLLLLSKVVTGQTNSEWNGTVTFPASYKVGDFREFIMVQPINAFASGNYEIAISYTRGNLAAGSTHLSSISHDNPALWREVGKVNSNGYMNPEQIAFTVDCFPQSANSKYRIRAVKVLGVETGPITINIKIRSISQNGSYTAISGSGTDLTINKYQTMTDEWSLYVGSAFSNSDANLALKAIANGNVGIGVAIPTDKLSVNGKIRAQEIKVESNNWPDYVFEEEYQLPSLPELEQYILKYKHLPDIPTATEVNKNGVNLGQINALLLKKIEELTLTLIGRNKELISQGKEIKEIKLQLSELTQRLNSLVDK